MRFAVASYDGQRYGSPVIRDFADKEAEKVWSGTPSRRLPADMQAVARRKLRMLNNAATLDAVAGPAAIVSGSCSEATNGQVAVWRAAGRTALHIDPLALHQGTQTADGVLAQARAALPQLPGVLEALDHLEWMAGHLDGVKVTFDLADLRGYAYYTGMRFSVYAQGASDALARGGRYDEVGSVFGRKRPAVGFSLDLKELVAALPSAPLRAAICAPWGDAPALRASVLASSPRVLRIEGAAEPALRRDCLLIAALLSGLIGATLWLVLAKPF